MTESQFIVESIGSELLQSVDASTSPCDFGKGVIIRLPKFAARKINRVKITLDVFESYTVTFASYRQDWITVSEFEGICYDQIASLIQSVTQIKAVA